MSFSSYHSHNVHAPHQIAFFIQSVTTMNATLIVAATTTNGIGLVEGANAKIPWRLTKDLAYFARATSLAPVGTRNAVVMGRRTWQSIPTRFKPLGNRLNIVLSRDEGFQQCLRGEHGGTVLVRDHLSDALGPFHESIHRLFIIGGASVYTEAIQMQNAQAKPLVDRILLTRLHSPAFEDCNVYFPEALNKSISSEWKPSTHADLEKWLGFQVPGGVQEEKGIEYEFQMWTR